MIGQPPGWTRQVSGSRVVLLPPGGTNHGAIRYDERKTPQKVLSAILAEQLSSEREFRVEATGSWERLVTIEGELGAAITVNGSIGADAAQRDLGVVYLDDAYALIDGYCVHPDEFAMFSATVRELTRGDSHFLGVRRRRFEYTPPRNWHARARGFVAEWFPRTFPSERVTIMVWPAMPRRVLTADAFIERVASEAGGTQTRETATLHTLGGQRLVIDHPGRHRSLVVLEDDRYIYPLQVEANTTAYDDVLHGVVTSIHPIPRPAVDEQAALPLAHWSE
jgi:hypothetical protein